MCKPDLRKLKSSTTNHCLLTTSRQVDIHSPIKCEDFSSKERLLRVTAYVLTLAKWLRQRAHHDNVSRCLTPDELQQAKTYWLKIHKLHLRVTQSSRLSSNNLASFMMSSEFGDVEAGSVMLTFHSQQSILCCWIQPHS